ncbi:MAG: sodium:solute symporter family protein [Phycisphaerae bacterium]|jgi:SSS family solute:Na+ symporter|nr:sodium:solute symporter family protein [Phycisphaerae bacterium]
MFNVEICILIGICLASVLVSYAAYRRGKSKSADDYFVAGSSLGYFVLIFSLLASFLSAFAMLGISGMGYRMGFGALFVLTVNLIPLGFLWYFMHRKTFLVGRARKWMSMGAPFGERYGTAMRTIIPVIVLVASIPYLVAQMRGIGLMIHGMSDREIPYEVGLFFAPAFVALYLILGGMKGAAWVNTVQGVFFTVMVFILFFAVMNVNGGFAETMDKVLGEHPDAFILGAKGGKLWSYPMIFGFAAAMCLGSVCFPQPYMHAYSSNSAKGFKVMIFVFGGICVVVISMTIMIGIAGKLLHPDLLTKADSDQIYILAAKSTLPRWAAGLAVAGAFTAAMTTVIGVVFGNASNITNDLYKQIKPQASAKQLVALGRICIAGIIAICIALAWNPNIPIAELAIIGFGIMAVTIFPLWGAYYWKRATRFGAIAGTLVGVGMNLVFIVWGIVGGKGVNTMLLLPQKFLLDLNGFLVSFIVAGIVFFGASLLTPLGKTETKSLKLFFHPSLD